MAPTGRWQKNKDILWYTRKKGGDGDLADEKRALKEQEDQLMREALGLAPKREKKVPTLAPEEAAELLQRSRGADDDEDPAAGSSDRVKGLGYSRAADVSGVREAEAEAGVRELLPGTGEGAAEERRPPGPPPPPPPGGKRGRGGDGHASDSSDSSADRKRAKKERKAAKKEKKKLKKEDKKRRKEEKRDKERR